MTEHLKQIKEQKKKCQLKRVMFTESYYSKFKVDAVLHLKANSHRHVWEEVEIRE
jgi:hypothetical protein